MNSFSFNQVVRLIFQAYTDGFDHAYDCRGIGEDWRICSPAKELGIKPEEWTKFGERICKEGGT